MLGVGAVVVYVPPVEVVYHFKPVPEEVFIEIIKDISHKIDRTIVTKVHRVSVKNQIDDWIKENKAKEIYDFCGEETNKKIISILSQVPKADKKRSEACMKFNTLFRNNKKNEFLPENLEHLNFMNHILLNKIKSLLFIFPEKIKNSKTYYGVPKHWDLDKNHIMEIQQNIFNYYRNIEAFHKNEELLFNLNKSDSEFDDFKRWITLPIHNQKTKNVIYYYIFVSIFQQYVSLKSPKMNEYMKVVVALFANEDSTALNFDNQKIEFITDMAKKSETQIKTDALKNLSREARKGMDLVDEDNYGTYGLDDGENIEGFDGDEYF